MFLNRSATLKCFFLLIVPLYVNFWKYYSLKFLDHSMIWARIKVIMLMIITSWSIRIHLIILLLSSIAFKTAANAWFPSFSFKFMIIFATPCANTNIKIMFMNDISFLERIWLIKILRIVRILLLQYGHDIMFYLLVIF